MNRENYNEECREVEKAKKRAYWRTKKEIRKRNTKAKKSATKLREPYGAISRK